jgi:hypothetical protein
MTARDVLALCRSRGVELVPDGGRLLLRGPQAARDELRELVRERKLELLAALRSSTAATTTCQLLPPDRPGQVWQYDWQGRPVNTFTAPKPEGLQ